MIDVVIFATRALAVLFALVRDDPTRERSLVSEMGLPAPCGWIQWKGTNVCMDVRCDCRPDALMHLDAEFTYFLRCPYCRRTFYVDGHVRLVPLREDEAAARELDSRAAIHDLEPDSNRPPAVDA